MSLFSSTDEQLDAFAAKYPGFTRAEAGLVRLIRAVDRQMTDKANFQLRQYGLTLSEYNVLTMLDASGEGLSVSQLAARTGEKASNTTRLTDQLVKKNLLLREISAQDRRVWLLKISSEGEALLQHLLPVIGAQLQRIFAPFSTEQCTALEQQLKTLLATTDNEPG
ncbi:MAG: MarR family transcriptional regulator [Pseudomonadota bacterium]|nr:MarR family transcriptional regulator [Pseudomonadota bacterium]